ncbi:MAG: hypothetical protein GC204_05545 [Chloroflexi bacterium]|nr:hypothetical protein [Chloroflexota bacterium]
MMESQKSAELVEILIRNRQLQSEDAFEAYVDALNVIRQAPKDSALLPRLILAFCDSEDYQAYWALFHYVESFPREDYLSALIQATPHLLADAQEWLRRMYLRILNSDGYRAALKTRLSEATPFQRSAVREILEQIPDYAGEDLRESFAEKVAFILSPEES